MVCSLRLRHHAFGARHVLHPSSSQFCFQCSCSARQNQRHQRLSFLIYAPQCLTKLKGLVLFQLPTNAVIGSSNAVALQCRQPTAGGSKLGLTQYTAASRTATKLIYVYIQYIYIYTPYILIYCIYICIYNIYVNLAVQNERLLQDRSGFDIDGQKAVQSPHKATRDYKCQSTIQSDQSALLLPP